MNYFLKKTKLLAIVAMMGVATGCNDFLEVNLDPTSPTSSPTNLLLTSAITYTGFNAGSDLHRYTLLFAQQVAAQNGRQTENFDAYIIQASELNGIFRNQLYGGPLADLEQVLAKDPAVTHPAYFGIAKLLKAFNYSQITDLWGDVPFTEALKGTNTLQPKLDSSRDIYNGLITLIDQGVADLAKTSPLTAPSLDDLIYSGNVQRWTRFGNSLKLRLYLHMLQGGSVTPEAVATFVRTTEASATVGFMTAVADDFQLGFESTANRQNPIHQFIIARTDDIAVSATIVDLMNARIDPRRAAYFTPIPFNPTALAAPASTTAGYVGLVNGNGASGVRNNLSRLHSYVRGNVTTAAASIPAGPALTVSGATALAYDGTAPVQMLTFTEYNFIRAELALRYSGPGTAQDFLTRGITASFIDAGQTAQAAAYVARQGTLTGAPADQLRQLIEEKYIANFMVAVEPWNDWRRTGFPVLSRIPTNIVNPNSSGRIPRVLLYPQQEVDANPNMKQRNYNERPVFWDTRTTGQQ